ncbi:MAG: MoaD/ThiS family protein [Cytophagales bacterium]
MLKIKLFGMLVEELETDSILLDDCLNTVELKNKLLTAYPNLKNLSFKIAVNQKISEESTELKESDEIVLLPPFSGG